MELLSISSLVGDGEVAVVIVKAMIFLVMPTKNMRANPRFRKTSSVSWLTEEMPTGVLFMINRLQVMS